MDSFGLNEGVSGHGSESQEATIGDCLEYLVGAALCYISHSLKPLHTLDPGEASYRLKNLVWRRWGLQGSTEARPLKRVAGLQLILQLAIVSYFIVSLRIMPATIDDTSVMTKYRTYVRCCSNVHIALGPSCWFFPPLFVAFCWYQLAAPTHWNTEGTSYEGIILEYLIGIFMAAVSNRVEPLWTIRPKVFCTRLKNLLWARWVDDQSSTFVNKIQGGVAV